MTGTAKECEEEESERRAAGNCTQPARNPVEKVTGEVKTIFGGGHVWGNKSAPTSDPHTLEIPGRTDGRLSQQETMLPAGGNSPRVGTSMQDIQKPLMGGNFTLHITIMGCNRTGGEKERK